MERPDLSLPKKTAGCILIITSALLFFFIIPEALTYGLFITSLVIVAIAAVGVVGYSLISPMSFKHFIGWLISALIVVLLPFAFILPAEFQAIIGSLLIIAIILLFYWGYKKNHKGQKRTTIDPLCTACLMPTQQRSSSQRTRGSDYF